MKHTQFLILEIGHTCNLAGEHQLCPVRTRMQEKHGIPLGMEERIAIGIEAYERHGFRGLIAFHYYNEPTLRMAEVLSTMEAISARVPHSRFMLYTNGTITPHDKRMVMFDRVTCSNYRDDPTLDLYYRQYIRNVNVCPANGNWQFDNRLAEWRGNPISDTPCGRPLIEFIIDDWGNGRLCCQDWRGDVHFGNVRDVSLSSMLQYRSELLRSICCPMSDFTPERCRRCAAKIGNVSFVPEIARDADAFYRG